MFFSQILFKFRMKGFKSFLIEIHPKDQSLMNQRYSWENLIYLRKEKFTSITFKAEVFQSVKTKENFCNEENSLKITNCYDNFYMLKLNCSFPWLKNKPRAQSFTSLMADLRQDINRVSPFSRSLNGTFP